MTGFKEDGIPLAVCIFILSVPGYVALAFRVYVRKTRQTWGLDDTCMCIAAFPRLGLSISGLLGAWYGMGQHQNTLTREELKNTKLFWTLFLLMYCITTMFVKLSVGFTLLRVAAGQKVYTRILWVMMGVPTTVLLLCFIYMLPACRPFQANWIPDIEGAKCLPPSILTALLYTMTGVNIVTDWGCAILPVGMLWNVQLPRHTKIVVAMLLGIGAMASVAALVRLKYLVAVNQHVDYTFTLGKLATWTYAEPGLGMIVGSLSALRPLVERWLPSSIGASDPLRRQYNASSSNKKSYYELGPFRRSRATKTNTTSTEMYGTAVRCSHAGLDADSESQQELTHKDGINVSYNVTVTEEDRQPRN